MGDMTFSENTFGRWKGKYRIREFYCAYNKTKKYSPQKLYKKSWIFRIFSIDKTEWHTMSYDVKECAISYIFDTIKEAEDFLDMVSNKSIIDDIYHY